MSSRSFRRAHERELEREARRAHRRSSRGKVAAGVGLGATVLFAPAADAATFTVTSLADDGSEGTLRKEVQDAVGADGDDTIVFQAGLSGTIDLGDNRIAVSGDALDIQGPGASVVTIDGGGGDQIIYAYDFDQATDAFSVSGLTLTNGYSTVGSGGAIVAFEGGGFAPHVILRDAVLTANNAIGDGGAVAIFYGALTVANTTVSGNDAVGSGGGIHVYAGNDTGAAAHALLVQDSSITGNSAETEEGGGISSYEAEGEVRIERTVVSGNDAGGQAGGAWLYKGGQAVAVSESTFANNTALYGGGGATFYDNDGPTTVSRSTFTGNTAGGQGGGLILWGTDDRAVIENTTISGNSAETNGGGVYSRNSRDNERLIRNSTIVGNTGGGIHANLYDNNGDENVDHLGLSSTIVANNTPEDLSASEDVPPEGSFVLAFSLVENATATVTESTAGSNLLGVDPQLGPLQNNGGPTLTHAPSFTSPVIDKGVANGLTTDQRGSLRTFDAANFANAAGGDGTDIGSVELLPGGRTGAALASCKGATENLLFAPGTAIVGTDANDVIVGTPAADQIASGKGKDKVCAGAGNDGVKAGAGKDNVAGQAGKDKLKGNGGNDKLQGNAGRDTLKGGGGKDTLKGGGGKDKLRGGPGRDKLKGGAGRDSERQ